MPAQWLINKWSSNKLGKGNKILKYGMIKIGTRWEYHKKIWNSCYGEDNCILCEELKVNAEHIIWKWKHWFVIRNIYPYSGTQDHLMAVPYRHVKFSPELSCDEFSEMKEIHDFMKEYFGAEHYFSATRETMWNRSIEHIHMHFLPGILQGGFIRCMLENQWFPIEAEVKIQK